MSPPERAPGQLRRRKDLTRGLMREAASIGPATVTVEEVGSPVPVTLVLDPGLAQGAVSLARPFVAFWVAKHGTAGRASTARADRTVLTRFFSLMGEAGLTSWEDLTVDFLVEVERHFASTSYWPGVVWAALRSFPADKLLPDVTRFVASPPNVPNRPKAPTEAIPAQMLRDMLRQALKDVAVAERRIITCGWQGDGRPPAAALMRRHEVTSFFVLLCMEWGQSPDVIAELSYDSARPTSVQAWNEPGQGVTVKWFKHRGGASGVELLGDAKAAQAGALLRRLRSASAATRAVAGVEWADSPWVFAEVVPKPSAGSGAADARRRSLLVWDDVADLKIDSIHRKGATQIGLRAWCEYERESGGRVAIDEVYAQRAGQVSFRAIRPAAKWARFTATGGGLLLSELVDDNTIETLSAHYLNNEVAMRDIAEAWGQVPTLAEEVARGQRPTVINKAGNVVEGTGLSEEEIRVARTENHVGTSGCLDPWSSPLAGEAEGRLCSQANRACFTCPSAVVTPQDIPVMKAYLLLAEAAHVTMSPPEWRLHWGLSVRWIKHVLPLLDADWETMPVAAPTLFDLGLQAGPG